ncbi:XdhC family protein [Methyloceanibacter caenitepidi]|uniref:Carbon monoxide dehydrogenase F protein n=1 Tax=Methyloceanibacter caenitepidi TaxID=1384459 RepID=A0A0A8K270_9HYPH|nr:XdhC family protein [Methyloceanibacter caenitepidi]BAQ16617.1 carbon monoxide dehydrogenase F protein [Methyloceanibacter caenitepidi]
MNTFEPQRPIESTPIQTARDWLETHDSVALATVVSAWGSAPVPVGGQLVVAPGGDFAGSVSGGCVEIDVITEAQDVIATGAPKLLDFGIADDVAWRAGLSCGGTIKVFIEPLRVSDRDFLDSVLMAHRSRRLMAVVTNLATGARRLIDPQLAEDPELIARISAGDSGIVELSQGKAFLQILMPPLRLVLAGGTHVTQVLASLATRVGYDVVIVDPRPAFASAARFGGVSVLEDWPEPAVVSTLLDTRTAVVALTHAAHLDDAALTAALRSDCFYVGALGSRKTHAKRLERLRGSGFGEDDLTRIHAPVGLAIGAKGPAEIAVSILAEIIEVDHGGTR